MSQSIVKASTKLSSSEKASTLSKWVLVYENHIFRKASSVLWMLAPERMISPVVGIGHVGIFSFEFF